MNNMNLSLNGKWAIHDDPDSLGYEYISRVVDGFVAATVPGNIQGDLEDSHVISVLRYGVQDDAWYGVPMKDWWYKKEFDLPEEMSGRRLTLDFAGVDYTCEVWLNGIPVGSHSGMFERFLLDVTDAVRAGSNTLFVRIEKMPEELLPYVKGGDAIQGGAGTPYHFVSGNNAIRNRLKGLKSPANLAYDWGTDIYTLGIWKDVTLRATGDTRIDWMQLKPVFTYTGKRIDEASVTVLLECSALKEEKVTVSYTFSDDKGVKSVMEKEFTVKAGDNVLEASLPVRDVKLWWPAGYGDQPLYTVSAEIIGHDSISDTTAFRDIRWTNCKGVAEDFEFRYQLVLNGLPIRTIGSNYESPDLMFGRTGRRAEHYVRMAVRCGMNFLRLHGASTGHNDVVFRAADKYGVMLSVEYPIGNCCIENEPGIMDALDVTYINFIKQLRNHPSIIEWGGGNELEWWFRPNEDRTAMYRAEKAANTADDTRLFRYTCPVPGSRHSPWTYVPDWHYKLYNLDDMGDNFRIAPNMRFAEFGVQTPSNIEVWYKDIPEKDRWPIDNNNPVLVRKNAVNSVFNEYIWFGMDVIHQLFGMPDNLEDAVKAGQFIGAEGLRYAFGQLRAKDDRIGGMTNWDYNEPWPNAAGSFLVDYEGRPVMMYWMVKEALAPISIQLRYEDIRYEFIGESYAEIQVLSDKPDCGEELYWEVRMMNRNGYVYGAQNGKVTPAYRRTFTVGRILLNPNEAAMFGPAIGLVSLKDKDGNIVSEKCYIFGSKGVNEPLRGLLGPQSKYPYDNGGTYNISGIYGGNIDRTAVTLERVGYEMRENGDELLTLRITNVGKMPALFTDIRPLLEYQTRLYIDKNFITVPAGESRIVTVLADEHEDRTFTLTEVGFTAEAFNADAVTLSPDENVIFALGRRDGTTHGYSRDLTVASAAAEGAILAASAVPYLVEKSLTLSFPSAYDGAAMLRLSLCDNDGNGMSRLTVSVNGTPYSLRLQPGLGVQKEEPFHLAWGREISFPLPAGVLRKGSNTVELAVSDGWISLDALSILGERK